MPLPYSPEPAPLQALPRPGPRRTKPWQHYLLWTVHNTIERSIRVGVPAIVLGVPLLIYIHQWRSAPAAPAHVPPPASQTQASRPRATTEAGLAQKSFDRKDYRGALDHASRALKQPGLGPDQRWFLQKIGMQSAFEIRDYPLAEAFYEESGRHPRLKLEFRTSAQMALSKDINQAKNALDRNDLPQALALLNETQKRANKWEVYQFEVAQLKANCVAAALKQNPEPDSTSLNVILPQQQGTAWVDASWSFQYGSPERRRRAVQSLTTAIEQKEWTHWLEQERKNL